MRKVIEGRARGAPTPHAERGAPESFAMVRYLMPGRATAALWVLILSLVLGAVGWGIRSAFPPKSFPAEAGTVTISEDHRHPTPIPVPLGGRR
jgi:hypothetical protein